jgi:hypothetical protein
LLKAEAAFCYIDLIGADTQICQYSINAFYRQPVKHLPEFIEIGLNQLNRQCLKAALRQR